MTREQTAKAIARAMVRQGITLEQAARQIGRMREADRAETSRQLFKAVAANGGEK